LINTTGHELETVLVISGLEDWTWLESAKLTITIDNGIGEKIRKLTSIDLDSSFLSRVMEKKSMLGAAVLVVLLLLAVISGGILYYRRRRQLEESEPLTSGPSMSTLSSLDQK